MICHLGPALGDVCEYAHDHDRYFSTERCYIREHALDLATRNGSDALGAFVRRRGDLCRPAPKHRWGYFAFCSFNAMRAWLRPTVNAPTCSRPAP